MTTIPTATGDIALDDLGATLMHEHVFLLSPGVVANWPHVFDRGAEVRRAVAMLDEAYAAGVRSIVELTTVDLGRDVALIAEVARQTRVRIIVATGVHLTPPGYLNRREPDRVTELFVHDIEQGIAGTGIRAGTLKIASAETVTAQNEVHLRAVARAHRQTGAPIMTHSDAITGSGATQQDVFAGEGVDLSRVVIGHSGDTTDLDYLSRLMERGSAIGMDRFGTGVGADTTERVATIAELCRRGFADRMVLSHDTSCSSDTYPWHVRARKHPDWNFTYISRTVLPALLEAGVSNEQVEATMVQNPRRIFAEQSAY